MKNEALKLANELENEAKYGECDWSSPRVSATMICRLVEELDKQGEPVAVIYQHPEHLRPAIKFTKPFSYKAMTAVNPDILLYTSPQTKPLSDEEIEYYEHLIAKLFNCSVTQKAVGLDRVIRAIEERHGIK